MHKCTSNKPIFRSLVPTYCVGLGSGDFVLWKMCVHLITVKVSVVGLTVGVV